MTILGKKTSHLLLHSESGPCTRTCRSSQHPYTNPMWIHSIQRGKSVQRLRQEVGGKKDGYGSLSDIPKLWIVIPPLIVSTLAIGFYFAERYMYISSSNFVLPAGIYNGFTLLSLFREVMLTCMRLLNVLVTFRGVFCSKPLCYSKLCLGQLVL